MDVGIGVADKEGYGTGTLGSGGFWGGGGDRRAYSVDQSTRSFVKVAEECRTVRRDEGDQDGEKEQYEEGEIMTRGEKGESRGQIQSGHKPYLESSHDGVWTLVRFPYPPRPLRARSAWTLPTALLASPRLLGCSNFCLQCVLSPSIHHGPGGPWSCERGHSTPEVDLILPHSGLSLGRPRHLIDGPGGLEVERVNHAGLVGPGPRSGTAADGPDTHP